MSALQQSLLALSSASAPGGNDVASANVVALLRMDGSGASFSDSGPNGLTVTASGSATQSSDAGAFGGKALSVGANTSDYVGIAANSLFSLGAGFTIAARVNMATVTSASICGLVDIGGAFSGVSIRANLGGTDLSYYWNSSNVIETVSWAAGTFSHAELGYDGTNAYLFFDGVLVDTTGPITITFGATPALRIGQVLEGADLNLDARLIDEVLIANTCLHTATFTPPTGAYNLV